MKNFHIVSAVIEVGTGLGMIVLPSLIAALLLGAAVTTSLELVMARLGGVALLALGLACFLAAGDAQSRAAAGWRVGWCFTTSAQSRPSCMRPWAWD